MGNNLFGANISGIVNSALGTSLLPATLHKVEPGTRTTGNLSAGTNPDETDFACRGMISDYSAKAVDGTIILRGDRKLLLLGDSIASLQVPNVGDQVTIEGKKWRIIHVKRDPDAATYSCQVR